MTSIASTSSYSNEEESSQTSASARSRLSHSSHSLESRGTHSTRGSVGSNTSRSSNTASRSTGSRSTASHSSLSSTSSSRYSRNDHKTREQDETARRLSTIHSVTSEQSQEECSNSDFSQYSTTSSATDSNTLSHASSSNRAELSLPSSFGGSAYRNNTTRALVKQDDGVVSIATQDVVSIKSDAESASSSLNTETQLALRVEKETKPMMHLVKLLKEMDPGSDDNGISKNNAIHSLIEEFEEEVVEIKQRITNPMLTNGEMGDSEEMQEMIMEELPPDWIALVDPDSGDVYYSNEVTGETTWDKPEMPKQLQDEDSYNESYNSRDDSQDSYNSNYEEESADEEDENGELPPDWVALEDVDSGDIYYANEVTGETTWDRPKMTKEDRQRMQQEFDDDQQQRQQQQPQPQSQDPQMNTDINNASNLSNDYQPSNPKEVHRQPADDEISADDSLPSDWIPLVDPDSGDTYFCNEVTGETSWDPPQFEKEEKKRRKNKATKRTEQQQQEEEEEYEIRHDGEDTAAVDDTEQEDLPEGWFSIVDPDSGDVYYSNEITGETTWDKPISENEPNLPENDTNHQTQFHQEQNSNFNRSESNTSESTDTALPPGWVASIDPDSGNEYYFNEETGETTWDKPISENEPNSPENDTNHQTQFHQEQNSNFNRSESNTSESTDKDLPPGWIASVDPDSGNEYYFNEETGETTWDKPEYQQIEQQISNSSADFSESASEWFPVVDPQSGDTYYANERTGETSWEKPEALLRLENQPHNNSGQDEAPLLTNSPANNDNDLPTGWFTAIDTQSGNEYYVNEQTGETTWDKPSVTHTPLLSNQPASEDENSLASGWFAVVEPTSGDIYYANEQTGATSWEKPRKQNNTNINNHSSLQSFHRNDSHHNQSSHGLSKMSLSMHENTVYESDSVTSSQY